MRDKLIELCENLILSCKASLCEDCEHNNIDYPHCMSVHFADHLLANGVIVPPCKVGDTVYRVVEPLIDDSFVIEGIVFEYAESFEAGKTKKRIYFWAKGEDFTRRAYSLWLEISEFGKTVFLTKEEAERALKGGEG